ncbi:MAG: PP2C family protein-serine/threonine phosphatase, partial [Muribaculaceae bacterium]
MRYTLKAYTIWESGQRKDSAGNPHQEDSLYPPHNQAGEESRLFMVCDGIGGHEAGEVASATVCESMSRAIGAMTSEGDVFTEEMFSKALSEALDALDGKDTGAYKKMGTTLTFLKLHRDGYMIAHIGDSRVYHIRPGKTAQDTNVMFVTKDHSLVNALIDAGELTPEEAKTFSRKNVITRAMQPKMEYRPKAGIHKGSDIEPGDYFYLCSDGMLENMTDEQYDLLADTIRE